MIKVDMNKRMKGLQPKEHNDYFNVFSCAYHYEQFDPKYQTLSTANRILICKHRIEKGLTNCCACKMPAVWMWVDIRCKHQPHYHQGPRSLFWMISFFPQ